MKSPKKKQKSPESAVCQTADCSNKQQEPSVPDPPKNENTNPADILPDGSEIQPQPEETADISQAEKPEPDSASAEEKENDPVEKASISPPDPPPQKDSRGTILRFFFTCSVLLVTAALTLFLLDRLTPAADNPTPPSVSSVTSDPAVIPTPETGLVCKRTEYILGGLCTQQIYDTEQQLAGEAANAVSSMLSDLDRKIGPSHDDSEIAQLVQSAGIAPVPLSDEVFSLLQKAQEYAVLSGGLFDITLAPLTQAWGFGTDFPTVVDDRFISLYRPLIGYDKLILNEEERTGLLQEQMMGIDLGGIAHGYACDRILEVYQSHGIDSALVSFGNSTAVLGSKPDGTDFALGIRDPRGEADDYLGVLHVSDCHISISADDQRFFEQDGVRYSHILDPRTGKPADGGLMSVTVIADSGIEADYLSTVLFIEGKDAALEKLNNENYSMILVDTDKNIYVSDSLKDQFVREEKDDGYSYLP